MKTKDIKEVIKEYLCTPNTQYALLINGDWGSGKTYFWEHEIVNIIDNIQPSQKKKRLSHIYISLNGISKIETIAQDLFIKLVPFLRNEKNSYFKGGIKVVSNIANTISKKVTGSSVEDLFRGVSIELFNFSDIVVCFDDLERCKVSIEEVLGFLNNLVEHKKLKAIILSNEKEILKENNKYQKIKEKTIGRTLSLEVEMKDILPLIFKRYKDENKEYFDFLNNQKDFILKLTHEYNQYNLRTLFFCLEILKKIFPFINDITLECKQEIILFAAIISFEFKQGNLTSDDYKYPKGNIDDLGGAFPILFNDNKEKHEKGQAELKQTYDFIFYSKYIENRSINYNFYFSIYSYILSGYLEETLLNKEIRKRISKETPIEIQELNRIASHGFRELSNEEFSILSGRVLQNAKEGKYEIHQYALIASWYYHFSEKRLIVESETEIKKIINDGLSLSISQTKEVKHHELDNILHFKNTYPENVQAIIDEIEKASKKILQEHNAGKKNKVIIYLENCDFDNLEKIFQRNSVSKELFEYIDVDLLFSVLINASNKTISRFTELLITRYTSSSNICDFLYEDKKVLVGLSEKIAYNKIVDSKEGLEKFLWGELLNNLNSFSKKLENAQPKKMEW